MGLLDIFKIPHEEDKEEQRSSATGTELSALFTGQEQMLEEDVLKIPTVQMCIELISGTIAQLPIYLYKENSDGSIERIYDDKRELILNQQPNEFQTAYNFKKNLVKDYLLYGASYNYIDRVGNEINSIHSFPTKSVSVTKYVKDGFIVVDADITLNEVNTGNPSIKKYKPHELLICLKDSKDGLTSKGLLYYGQSVFDISTNELDYINSIYKNGAMPLGVLQTEGQLNEDAITKLRNAWNNLYVGRKNAGKTIILENGLKYSPISQKPKDLLVNENKKDNISEICKLFNMQESFITGTNKYGNIEQNNILFLQYTLSPILSAIENGIDKSFLLEEEKTKGYFWSVDTSEVLKTTEKEKYDAIKSALDSGIMSINEARYKLNMPFIKDDIMKWSLGNVLYYPDTGEMKVPNMGIGIENKVEDDVKTEKQPEQKENEKEIKKEAENE